jgi:hypothetical protein
MPDDLDSLIVLAKKCIVKIRLPEPDGGFCTGFFAAPGVIVSCRHGIADKHLPEKVAFEWNDGVHEAQRWIVPDDADNIDYSVFHTELPNHPFLPLHPDSSIYDEVFIPAFSTNRPEGTGRMARFDSLWDEEQGILFLVLKGAQLEHGMSGAPLLNLRTRCVCGLLKCSRDILTDLGGRAVSVKSILQHMRKAKNYNYASTLCKSDSRLDSEQRRRLFGSPDFPDPSIAWQAILSKRLDAAFARTSGCYLDLSSKRVARIMRKLDALIDLDARLTVSEHSLLAAVVACRTMHLVMQDVQAEQLLRGHADSQLIQAVENTLNIADTGLDSSMPLPKVSGFRCDLVAALILLGECLDLDRDAISPRQVNMTSLPSKEDPLEWWLAYLTRSIYSPYRGIIIYQLLVPFTQKDAENVVMPCVAARFSVLYQHIRESLCAYGISISRGRSEVTFSRNAKPLPAHVLENLKGDSKERTREIRRLEHLGPRDELERIPIEELLPIPESVVSGEIAFSVPVSTTCRVYLKSETDLDAEHVVSLQSGSSGQLLLDLHQLPYGRRFFWRIEVDFGGFFAPLKSGVFRTLTHLEKAEIERVSTDAPSHLECVQARIGLRSDVLRAIWNRIEENKASMEDLLLAQSWLSSAFEWSYRNGANTRFFEKYLDACNWLKDAITYAER